LVHRKSDLAGVIVSPVVENLLHTPKLRALGLRVRRESHHRDLCAIGRIAIRICNVDDLWIEPEA